MTPSSQGDLPRSKGAHRRGVRRAEAVAKAFPISSALAALGGLLLLPGCVFGLLPIGVLAGVGWGVSQGGGEDEPPSPPPTFAPPAIAVGDDALIMLTDDWERWTNVGWTLSSITPSADLAKVVKVPGHSSGRLVAIVNRGDTTDTNAEIWYADNGGNGAWTKASYGVAEANLCQEHRSAGISDDWDLNDILFLDSLTGYAVGTNSVLLWTYDAGQTWFDLNEYQQSSPPIVSFQMLTLTGAPPLSFVPGTVITGTGTESGTIISIKEDDNSLVVKLTTPSTSAFTASSSIVFPATAGIASVWEQNIWRCQFPTARCLFGIRTGGTQWGVHSLWIGTGNTAAAPSGVWRIVTNDPATPTARTFNFYGPDRGDQNASGQIGYGNINRLVFFDNMTGAAATSLGVWYTVNGVDWTQLAASASHACTGLAFSFEDTAHSGYLHSISNASLDNPPGRIPVTYTYGTPGTWSFGATPSWELHGAAYNCAMYYARDGEVFLARDKMIVFAGSPWANGEWAWCRNFDQATVGDALWQDTSEQYLGGTVANGDNPAYAKEIFGAGSVPASGYVRWICLR